jgi:hypothetical protein
MNEVAMGEISASACSFVPIDAVKAHGSSMQLKRLLRRSVLLWRPAIDLFCNSEILVRQLLEQTIDEACCLV